MTEGSALYRGAVAHRRLRPRSHRLRYRVFWLLLDLAEVDMLSARCAAFSRNRFNLLSFHDRDHGDGSDTPLRAQVEAKLTASGIDLGGGKIRLLTMPRVLGYVFNPISLYYCHHADGRLMAMIYEVTSTFGERHAYVAPVRTLAAQRDGQIRQTANKALYVSPFMDMDMGYVFRGRAPGETLALAIEGRDSEGLLIAATLAGERRAFTDGELIAASAAIPLLTLKVTAAIHWEALKLWLKRVPLTRPPSPDEGQSVIAGHRHLKTS